LLHPFDLHVLGLPPAFVLSQDQTLKFETFGFSRCAFDESQFSTFPSKLGFMKTQGLSVARTPPPAFLFLSCTISKSPPPGVDKTSPVPSSGTGLSADHSRKRV
jgi:hypothetical protein